MNAYRRAPPRAAALSASSRGGDARRGGLHTRAARMAPPGDGSRVHVLCRRWTRSAARGERRDCALDGETLRLVRADSSAEFWWVRQDVRRCGIGNLFVRALNIVATSTQLADSAPFWKYHHLA